MHQWLWRCEWSAPTRISSQDDSFRSASPLQRGLPREGLPRTKRLFLPFHSLFEERPRLVRPMNLLPGVLGYRNPAVIADDGGKGVFITKHIFLEKLVLL